MIILFVSFILTHFVWQCILHLMYAYMKLYLSYMKDRNRGEKEAWREQPWSLPLNLQKKRIFVAPNDVWLDILTSKLYEGNGSFFFSRFTIKCRNTETVDLQIVGVWENVLAEQLGEPAREPLQVLSSCFVHLIMQIWTTAQAKSSTFQQFRAFRFSHSRDGFTNSSTEESALGTNCPTQNRKYLLMGEQRKDDLKYKTKCPLEVKLSKLSL